MALIIVVILLIGYLLIATEKVTNVNKAAVAIFVCTVGWVLYISYGNDFVMSQHPAEYATFLNGDAPSSIKVKEFIASNIFLKYVGRACDIVLFLLSTMTIVEILNNNGCFDFIRQLMRTRNSRRMLWTLSLATLVISANLDNLTTAVMMLVIMRGIIPNRRQRLIYGSAIVIAANCGGALTVIGDPSGLMLWDNGLVTASSYFLSVALPCLVAWAVPTWWIGRMLPEHVDSQWITMPYRGDDTRLNVWQRLVMLIVGIGGLWFCPTFHNITRLSPFLGAMCVLAILWIVNEAFNHKLLSMDRMVQRRTPQMLIYSSHQMILFVLGMMMALGVVMETGMLTQFWNFLQAHGCGQWILGIAAGCISSVLDNFATASSFYALNPSTVTDAAYFKIIAYATAVGGNVLCMGSMAGMALMKAERMHVGWYFQHVGWKTLVGSAAGLGVMALMV